MKKVAEQPPFSKVDSTEEGSLWRPKMAWLAIEKCKSRTRVRKQPVLITTPKTTKNSGYSKRTWVVMRNVGLGTFS